MCAISSNDLSGGMPCDALGSDSFGGLAVGGWLECCCGLGGVRVGGGGRA